MEVHVYEPTKEELIGRAINSLIHLRECDDLWCPEWEVFENVSFLLGGIYEK